MIFWLFSVTNIGVFLFINFNFIKRTWIAIRGFAVVLILKLYTRLKIKKYGNKIFFLEIMVGKLNLFIWSIYFNAKYCGMYAKGICKDGLPLSIATRLLPCLFWSTYVGCSSNLSKIFKCIVQWKMVTQIGSYYVWAVKNSFFEDGAEGFPINKFRLRFAEVTNWKTWIPFKRLIKRSLG